MAHQTIDLPRVDLDAPHGTDELEQGLFETGFFLLADHVIPRPLLDAVRRSTLDFMARPEDEKARVQGPLRGWSALRAESAAANYSAEEGSATQDVCEKFTMGALVTPEMRDADPAYYDDPDGAWYFGENLFPDDAMRASWQAYYTQVQELSARLVDVVRQALGLAEGVWESIASRPPSVLRFLAYPNYAGGVRMGAHYDSTLLTVLHQSVPENGFAALQVQLPGDDEWRSVAPSDDVFVVNIGEALTYLSGGRVVATKHRVVGPPEGSAAGSARTSLVHFHLPNWNARLLPTLPREGDAKLTRLDAPDLREPDGSILYYKAQRREIAYLTGSSES